LFNHILFSSFQYFLLFNHMFRCSFHCGNSYYEQITSFKNYFAPARVFLWNSFTVQFLLFLKIIINAKIFLTTTFNHDHFYYFLFIFINKKEVLYSKYYEVDLWNSFINLNFNVLNNLLKPYFIYN
jgi:hypothetical protein